MVISTEPLVMCTIGTTVIALREEVHIALLKWVLWGCGSPVVKVSDHGRHVMSSSPVPLKICRVGQRCILNLSKAETSSRWCGVVWVPSHVNVCRNEIANSSAGRPPVLGHTRAQLHVVGRKVYPPCLNCNVTQAVPAHD
ncbi:uncharacterized protein TNCV_2393441 [Trichonephila clavipes]|nr:uncharacterized protein TNCV_2393441 [Trichonephila clavipes]